MIKLNNNVKISRKKIFLNELLIVDGQSGAGKELISTVVNSMKRVEITKLHSEIENICKLKYFNQISFDGAKTFLRIHFDLILYELMMSRNLNFRPKDYYSAYNNNFFRYLVRLFQEGNSSIPNKIIKNKPILHLMTHNILPYSKLLFETFENKCKIIHIQRHPKLMLPNRLKLMKKINSAKGQNRQFNLYVSYKDKELPIWLCDSPNNYLKANNLEKAMMDIIQQTNMSVNFNKHNQNNKYNILNIPFEKYIINPWLYIKKIETFLKTERTNLTNKSLKKTKVPRKNFNFEKEVKNIDNLIISEKVSIKLVKKMNKISQEYESLHNL